MARLPQKLLAHPRGGALAVIGHIDRAWSWSFQSDDGTAQTGDFRMILNSLMAGDRIGQATDQFNGNWGALSTEIADTFQQVKTQGRKLSPANSHSCGTSGWPVTTQGTTSFSATRRCGFVWTPGTVLPISNPCLSFPRQSSMS